MSRAGLRVDLYRSYRPNLRDIEYRWRLWSSSSIIAASSEGYDRRSRAIANLETVLNGTFEKVSTPAHPKPFGILYRTVRSTEPRGPIVKVYVFVPQNIPVRLLP